MRFARSLQFNAVPEWSSNYIAYNNLKKRIKSYHRKDAGTTQEGDTESRPLIAGEQDFVKDFSAALDKELKKITEFFKEKEEELYGEVERVVSEVGGFDQGLDPDESGLVGAWRQPPLSRRSSSIEMHSDDSEDEIDESTGLTQHGKTPIRRTRTTGNITDRSVSLERPRRRNSTTMIVQNDVQAAHHLLKRQIIQVYVQLCELKSFIQMNETGFRKVLKKFDKNMNCELKDSYMENSVRPAYPFLKTTKTLVEANISKMTSAYAELVTGSDMETATKYLRAHLREHIVWERNTVWRDLISIERRGDAPRLGKTLLGSDADPRLIGDEPVVPATTKIRTPLGLVSFPTWLVSLPVLLLLAIIGVFVALLHAPILKKPEQQNCLAVLVFASLLWATETIPLFATSMLIPFLVVVLRITCDEHGQRLQPKQAVPVVIGAMWSPVIMLLLGGLTLAAALSKSSIDRKIATWVLSKAGTTPRIVLLAIMFVAAFASMLISNVAAPVLCFSVIDPVLRNLPQGSAMSKAVILGIALSSNVGGMLSPISSPQNVVAMGIMNPPPSWGAWFLIVIPVGIVSLLMIWVMLVVSFRPGRGTTIVPIRAIRDSTTATQWFVTVVSMGTIVLWCLSHQLEGVFGDMGVIAIMPMVLMFGIGVLTKEDFNNFPWTIIMLAAGGLSLGSAVRSSGLLHLLASAIQSRVLAWGWSLHAVLIAFSLLIAIVATFISHTVAALIFLPIVADVGAAMPDPHPNILVMAAVLICSAAMALPTSGFPNMTAIMKEDQTGQRYLTVQHFISRGVPATFMTVCVVITLGYLAMTIVL